MPVDLALVMPTYNESECIARVVAAWRESLAGLGISYRMIVLDDGSRDDTAAQLDAFRSDPAVEILHQANMGHGPTILRGYRHAVDIAEWVFQCDSDDEISPGFLSIFWQRRGQYDAVLGIRERTRRSCGRMIISTAARLTIRLFFGPGVRDVNVPYRLIRASLLKDLVVQIPPGTFAPNVVISGAMARARLPILQIPVRCEGRKTGSPSIVRLKLWRSAAISLWQTLACRPTVEKRMR
jgi:glycosyltransferase involved in cell wall biosynthesis